MAAPRGPGDREMSYAYGLSTECYELNGSPVEEATDTSFTATVRLRCPWPLRRQLAAELSDYTLYQGASGVAARVRSISIAPLTDVQGAGSLLEADYEEAVLTVRYVFDRDTPTEDGGDLLSETLEPTAQNLTMAWERFRWAAGGQSLEPGEVPSKILRGMDYVLTKYNLSAIPAAALTLVGCCNDAPVTAVTLGLTFPAETLLFNPPTLHRKVSLGPSAENRWTATYRFTYKPEGWNTFWNAHADPPRWDSIQIHNGAGYVAYQQYPPASFSGL